MYCKQCGTKITDNNLQKCPKCNTTIGKGGRFCELCGKQKKNPKEVCECQTAISQNAGWVCQSCGTKNEGKFCSQCGTSKDYIKPKDTKKQESIPVAVKKNEPTIKTNNPLYAKIAARDDKKEVSEIVKKQAIKMVYGPEAVEQMDKVEENAQIDSKTELENNPVNNAPVAPVIEAPTPIKEDFQPVKGEEVQSVSKTVREPNYKNENKVVSEETPTFPEDTKVKADNVFPEFTEGKQDNKEEKHSNSLSQVDVMFPEAFSEEKLKAPSVGLPKIDRTVAVKEKQSIAFFWIVSLILSYCTFNYIGSSVIATIVSLIGVVVFGAVDAILSKKKYGIGVILGTILMVIIKIIF